MVEFGFSILSLVYLACGFLGFGLAVIVWNRRPGPGITPLTTLIGIMAFWVLIYALEISTTSLSVVIILGKLEYLAALSTGIIWLCFAFDYSSSAWWKNPRNLILVGFMPFLILLITWTNELHGWIWADVYLTEGPFGLRPVWVPGPLYYVDPFYQYFLYLLGILVLVRYALNYKKKRKPICLLLAGTIIPIIGSILYIFRIFQPGGQDIFPLYIFVAMILYCITILRYNLIDIIPAAYKILIGDIPNGILILDTSDEIKEINPACEKLLNTGKMAATGQPLQAIYPQLSSYISTTQDVHNILLDYQTNEKTVCLDTSIVVLRNKKKQVIGKLIELKDITELKNTQKRLEELLNQERNLKNELEEESQKRNQFSRAVVHELRTPLTAIMASNELLGDILKDKIAISLVNNIERSSHNLEQRVNELFELARGESGLIKVELEDIDLEVVITEIISELQPLAAEKQLSLKADLPGGGLTVMGDKSRLRQVLINLIGNSLKFTRRGDITVSASKSGADEVIVQVKDSGCGMAPEEMENLFNPYRRQKQGQAGTLGLGIGLALSKIYVELHHGQIKADSTAGEGTTVTFTLPLYKSPLA